MSAESPEVRSVRIDEIVVGGRLRTYREEAAASLAESIARLGLLQPIAVLEVDGGYRLVAGRHRLEACRKLGWSEVRAAIATSDELDAQLAEIDENLFRAELTVLERGEHLVRRDQILKATGRRAPGHRPRKGGTNPPFSTTAGL